MNFYLIFLIQQGTSLGDFKVSDFLLDFFYRNTGLFKVVLNYMTILLTVDVR